MSTAQKSQANDSIYSTLSDLVALRHQAGLLPRLSQLAAQSTLSGANRSASRGRGLMFEELRHYQPGDDTRQLDWKATRRTGRPMVRVFSEERERPVYLLLDMQSNMFFGSRYRLKSVQAAHLAALLMWQTVGAGDRFGTLLCGPQQVQRFRPQHNEKQLLRLLQVLVESNHQLQYAGQNDPGLFGRSLSDLGHLARHSSDIWLISDLDGLSRLPEKQLQPLVLHNEVRAVLLSDPLEQNLPAAGRWGFSSGDQYLQLNTAASDLRRSFSEQYQQQLTELEQQFRRMRVPLLQLTAAEPLPQQLMRLAGGVR